MTASGYLRKQGSWSELLGRSPDPMIMRAVPLAFDNAREVRVECVKAAPGGGPYESGRDMETDGIGA